MGNRRVLVTLGLLVVLSLATPGRGTAHPLGNFSISRYTGIEVGRNVVTLRYFVDMAEIPTFQELQTHGITSDPAAPRVSRYVRDTAETLKQGLELAVGGRRLALEVRSAEVIFPEGAGGLPTMKLAILYRASLRDSLAGPEDLSYRDDNFASRAGWREVIAVAHSGAAIIERSVPAQDRSRELSDYPTDLLDSPPQVSQARLRFTRPLPSPVVAAVAPPAPKAPVGERHSPAPPEPAIAPRANVQATTSGSAFTELIGARELTVSVVAIALVVAAALGALHALEPGHGKTVVAAYLVGSRGTAWHAVLLGLIVTASHTAGVYLLGAATIYASRYVVPERLYPWVALGSGLVIAVLGLSLFLRRYAGRDADHGHHHHHGHGHHHHEHAHDHAHGGSGHDHHSHVPGSVSLRQLWALGITGGIVPCPAALVVLLSALSLRRVGFGLLLIVAFSLGLALVLVGIGLLVVHAGRLVTRLDERGPLVTRWLPLMSSAVMTLLGLSIAIQAVASGGLARQLT
jgi:ABC-type nickel/cobalt efflux system permease component RcnA